MFPSASDRIGRAGWTALGLLLVAGLPIVAPLTLPAPAVARVSVVDTSRVRTDTLDLSSEGIRIVRRHNGRPDTLIVGKGKGSVEISHRGIIVEDGDGGDVVRMGDDIHIKSGDRVSGDVVAIGGTVTIDGMVQGDAVAIGGDMVLGDSAVVAGDAVSIGGQTVRPEGAHVGGETVTVGVSLPGMGKWFRGRHSEDTEDRESAGGAFVKFLFWVVFYLVVLAFAALCLAATRDRIQFAADYMRREPLITFLLGIFSPLMFFIGFILLLITIIGIPVALALMMVFPILIFLGWVVAGYRVGSSVRQSSDTSVRTVFTGLLVISAVHLLGIVLRLFGLRGFPVNLLLFLGWGASFLAALIGLGAILGTRFRRPMLSNATMGGYPTPGAGVPPPPPPIGGGPITTGIDPAAPSTM